MRCAAENSAASRQIWSIRPQMTLRRHGIDVDHVVALISGECTDCDRFFDGPINFDTIEGVLRSREYIRPTSTGTKPDTVTEAAIRREEPEDRDVVDSFWECKNWVYKHVINSRLGVFEAETSFFKRLPRLKKLLVSHQFESDVRCLIDEPVQYRNRNYYIDPDGDFFARRDHTRYKHKVTTDSLGNWKTRR